MKKVYCKNCKYFRRESYHYYDKELKGDFIKHIVCCVANTPIGDLTRIGGYYLCKEKNENNNCCDYKKKWWKIFKK